MSEKLTFPAETYKLNCLASALGRYAIYDPDQLTIEQTGHIVDKAIDILSIDDAPAVPHTNPDLLNEAIKFDEKLLHQTNMGCASQFISKTQKKSINFIIKNHYSFCKEAIDGNAGWQMLSSVEDIAESYGMPELFKNSAQVLNDEKKRWGIATQHPSIPTPLQKKVNQKETAKLMDYMWSNITNYKPSQETDIYLTDRPEDYHLFWAPTAAGLDYATPGDYDRALQLSFDLPHNSTHLAHLDAMAHNLGVYRYNDNMAERAYFEAVAVLSEYICENESTTNKSFGEGISEIYGLDPKEWGGAINDWIRQDRRYEFKLRAVRYAADILMVQGASLSDTIDILTDEFNIPRDDAKKETLKYLPWTGLGSVYTQGYRKLIDNNIITVRDGIFNEIGEVKTSW